MQALTHFYNDRLVSYYREFRQILKMVEERESALQATTVALKQVVAHPQLMQLVGAVAEDILGQLEESMGGGTAIELEPPRFKPQQLSELIGKMTPLTLKDANEQSQFDKIKQILSYAHTRLTVRLEREFQKYTLKLRVLRETGPEYGFDELQTLNFYSEGDVKAQIQHAMDMLYRLINEHLQPTALLIISPDDAFYDKIRGLLASNNLRFFRAHNRREVRDIVTQYTIPIVFYHLPEALTSESESLLQYLKSTLPQTTTIAAFLPNNQFDTVAAAYGQGFHHVLSMEDAFVLIQTKMPSILNLQYFLAQNTMRDPITLLPNHRYFFNFYERTAALAWRGKEALSLAVLELKSYQSLHDEHGQFFCNEWIKHFAYHMTQTLRRSDSIVRWEPNRFLFLFPKTEPRGAVRALEKMYQQVRKYPFKFADQIYEQTFYAGVVSVAAQTSLEAATYRAWEQLNQAKEPRHADILCDQHELKSQRVQEILIVDDDEFVVRILRRYLEKDGYQVEHLFSGEAAFDKLLNHPYALGILDIKMPGMDGFELLEKLRSMRQLDELPLVMLSSMNNEADVVRAFELGADDYIYKPFSNKELMARIRRLLRR